eukprot:m.1608806 g.1608806  ORF g.1608806 m.1608806 type:complete len:63 (+) comp25364_c0_seq13:85-273(+)
MIFSSQSAIAKTRISLNHRITSGNAALTLYFGEVGKKIVVDSNNNFCSGLLTSYFSVKCQFC